MCWSNGMAKPADRRRDLWRTDKAAQGEMMQVAALVLGLRVDLGGTALDSELLFGETFEVFARDGDYVWGRAPLDGYVGYVAASGLADMRETQARIWVRNAPVYPEPSMKSVHLRQLSFGSRVAPTGTSGSFVQTRDGFIHQSHLGPSNGDLAGIATLFLGAPYIWGGRSGFGLDCSALVQLSAQAIGMDCPRDSDMQFAEFGTLLPQDAALKRNDMVFWDGHVGILEDDTTLLHATAAYMNTVREPFGAAAARIKATEGLDVLGVKRL
jgi:cell wall-associated NlpC family hydrolase